MKRSVTLAVLCAALAAACDAPRDPALPGTPRAIAIAPSDSLPTYIETTDSWLSANLEISGTTTIVADSPFVDPGTGALTDSLTVVSPVDSISVAAGYDASGNVAGQMTFGLDHDPAADPGTQVARTQFVNGTVTDYDGNGQPMSPFLSDGSPAPQLTPADLNIGSDPDEGVLIDPVDTSSGGLLLPPPDDGSGGLTMSRAAGTGSGVRRRVERPDNLTLRVIDDVDDDAGDVDASSLPAAVRLSAAQGQAVGTSHVTRTYKRRGSLFVLDNIRLEREQAAPGHHVRHVQTMRYSRLKWHRNPAKNRERAAHPAPQQALRAAPAAPPAPVAAPAAPRGMLSAATESCAVQTSAINQPHTGRHVVLEHGFTESGCSYSGGLVSRTILSSLKVDDVLTPTTGWGSLFEVQATSLAGTVSSYRSADHERSILVGFSNGGVVSRQVAHTNLALVEGVISVSTPHNGVPAVRTGIRVLNTVLAPVKGAAFVLCKLLGVLCIDNLSPGSVGIVGAVLGATVPVVNEDANFRTPGTTTFLDGLNLATESFSRVGIEQHPRQRWLLWRVIGGLGSCTDPVPCGRGAVADQDRRYDHLKKLSVIHFTFNPFKLASRAVRAAIAGIGMLAYNAADGAFNYVMAPGDGSDGLVPFASQRYPRPSFPAVAIQGADSHAEMRFSPLVVDAVKGELANHFNVAKK